MLRYHAVVLLVLFVLVGCSANMREPRNEAATSTQLPSYTDAFDSNSAWDTYTSEGLFFDVAEGMMRALLTQRGLYVWSLNRQTHENATIEITTLDVASADEAFMGVMCRASAQNDGRGYHFLISGDGAFSIRYGTASGTEALVRWQNHGAIQQGSNRLRVTCEGADLRFYANDRLLAAVRDERYNRGRVGLVVGLPASAPAAARADVAFDDLRVWE